MGSMKHEPLRLAGHDITLTPNGSIRLPSLAKALRDPAFAGRVRCTLERDFDGQIDGQREVKEATSAESIAAKLDRPGAGARRGMGAYVEPNNYTIHVYDYCSSWSIVVRDEEIRRLETLVEVVAAWTVDYTVAIDGRHPIGAKALATREVRAHLNRADAFAFDDAVNSIRGITDPMRAVVALCGCSPWQQVAV